MKLPVHVFACTRAELDAVALMKLDNTFEWKLHLWGQGDWTPTNALDSAHRLFRREIPAVWITIHANPNEYRPLFALPFEHRKKWLHYESISKLNPAGLIESFLDGNIHHKGQSTSPLISFFTAAFKSGERIMRPYNSLRNQTYQNWQWVIVCDALGEDDPNWKRIIGLAATDSRILACRMSHHSGYIGAMKRCASGLCTGVLYCELDHDDDLVPQCCEWLVQAMKDNPECGFFFSDFIELFEDSADEFSYGPLASYGFSGYFKQLYKGKWQCRYFTQGWNPLTCSHIVGYPNHIRCWKADVYHRIGGHNSNLPVVDDWELGLRTFGETKWCHINEMMYIQYRNRGGENQTFLRNALIQDLVRLLRQKYEPQNRIKFIEAGVPYNPDFTVCLKEYECANFRYPRLESFWKPRRDRTISIIMPTYNRETLLTKAIQSVLSQTFQDWELYIVGDKCPVLEKVMAKFTMDERIRYWNLDTNYGPGGAVPRNYALRLMATKWCAFLDDDNEWLPNHLQTLWDKVNNENVSFVWSSLQIGGKPIVFKEFRKGRIDTSCILFKHELMRKYGFWKNRIEGGYAHDFELFHRWVTGGESWAVTKLPTVIYNCETNDQTYESILSMNPGDQMTP